MNLKKKIKAVPLCLFLLLPTSDLSAQQAFKYEVAIKKVDSTGFYKIYLSPDFIAKCNKSLSDIRLIDEKNLFVPYINKDALPVTHKTELSVFSQIKTNSKRDTGTTLIVENKKEVITNQLWVRLKNTDVQRTVNLYGSDDRKEWFAIKENIALKQTQSGNTDSYLQSLSFSPSNYHYFKLLVNDKHKAPLKILEAGIYTDKIDSTGYVAIPIEKIIKNNTDTTTKVEIVLNDNYLINCIALNVSEPKYFKRSVNVYAFEGNGYQLINSTELSSTKVNTTYLNAKTKKVLLEIFNGENTPLIISKTEVLQADEYIIAYLETGKNYKLLTGSEKIVAADYDLKFFVDSIDTSIPKVNIGEIKKNSLFHLPHFAAKKDYTIVIWIAISGALLLLSLLTWKMMTEVNKKL